MGLRDAKKFLDKVEKDEALQKRIGKLKKGDFDKLAKLAEKAGFDFTAEEFEAGLEGRSAQATGWRVVIQR